MPAPVPAARFWSFTVYDNQTRSLLETDQLTAGLDSTMPGHEEEADGSATIYFGAEGTRGPGRQLGSNPARQRLERDPPFVWAVGAVAQPVVEAW